MIENSAGKGKSAQGKSETGTAALDTGLRQRPFDSNACHYGGALYPILQCLDELHTVAQRPLPEEFHANAARAEVRVFDLIAKLEPVLAALSQRIEILGRSNLSEEDRERYAKRPMPGAFQINVDDGRAFWQGMPQTEVNFFVLAAEAIEKHRPFKDEWWNVALFRAMQETVQDQSWMLMAKHHDHSFLPGFRVHAAGGDFITLEQPTSKPAKGKRYQVRFESE